MFLYIATFICDKIYILKEESFYIPMCGGWQAGCDAILGKHEQVKWFCVYVLVYVGKLCCIVARMFI